MDKKIAILFNSNHNISIFKIHQVGSTCTRLIISCRVFFGPLNSSVILCIPQGKLIYRIWSEIRGVRVVVFSRVIVIHNYKLLSLIHMPIHCKECVLLMSWIYTCRAQ